MERKNESISITGKNKKGRKLVIGFKEIKIETGKKTVVEEQYLKKIDIQNIRRITIDSVFSPTDYRLLVSKYKTNCNPEEISFTRNWDPEVAISRGIKTKTTEKGLEDPIIKKISLKKEEIVERRVYLIINDYKFDITDFARQDAKGQYNRLLSREGGR